MDVAEEEATEDFHKGAAVTPFKNQLSGKPVFGNCTKNALYGYLHWLYLI